MAQTLSVEQVLLLNNLMYMDNKPPLQNILSTDAQIIRDYIDRLKVEKLESRTDYGSFMTGNDWKNIIQAVKNDDRLMNMRIAAVHEDALTNGTGGGKSAVFTDSSMDEAVVVFCGTASHEWKDNLVGGGRTNASDGVSTVSQEDALSWFQSLDLSDYNTITVTGHSKGGNKAKYITVRDDSVNRCLSFDGQGFSDEFMYYYEEKIRKNQHKIINSNVDGDYVNLLLNDIGHTDYYKGYDYGVHGFLENHCPNTFFHFHTDGSFEMKKSSRDKRTVILDEFINNYLRALLPEQKKETLSMMGDLIQSGFHDASDLKDILLKDCYFACTANLTAYLFVYGKEKPELIRTVGNILDEMNLPGISAWVKIAAAVAESEFIRNMLVRLYDLFPNRVDAFIKSKLEENGIYLSEKNLAELIHILQTAVQQMEYITIMDNGKDIRFSSVHQLMK